MLGGASRVTLMSTLPDQPDGHTMSRRGTIAFYIFVYGILAGCFILSGLLQLTTWVTALLIIKVTIVIVFIGVVYGILAECLIGRRKSLRSNFGGILLVVTIAIFVAFLPKEMTIAIYFDKSATQISSFGTGIGITAFAFSIGGAFSLGRYVVRQVQIIRHRKHLASKVTADRRI